MIHEDFSSIILSLQSEKRSLSKKSMRQFRSPLVSSNIFGEKSIQVSVDNSYQLVNVSIVFHILVNQDNGYVGSPNMTNTQREYAVRQTNAAFNIYDRNTKKSMQFVNFVWNETIVHTDIIQYDCGNIPNTKVQSIIKKSIEWQYMEERPSRNFFLMIAHCIICSTLSTKHLVVMIILMAIIYVTISIQMANRYHMLNGGDLVRLYYRMKSDIYLAYFIHSKVDV